MESTVKQVALINPALSFQKDDVFTTGIPYMPIGLAQFAAVLEERGISFRVVDAFGEAPNSLSDRGKFMFRGLEAEEVVRRIDPGEFVAAVVYAINMASFGSMIEIVGRLKSEHPGLPVVLLENTQAVTSCALWPILDDLFAAGADYVVTGEPERRGVRLIEAIAGGQGLPPGCDGIAAKSEKTRIPAAEQIEDLDALPFPAWERFPIENYWKLRYAHGPLSSRRYLPLQTSRGCPFGCGFCVSPEVNKRRWRSRSPRNVVDEMEHWNRVLGVREFHIEDLDPTVNDARVRDFCRDLIQRRLPVRWKICAGTKVETLKDEETVSLMARAGCRYISISPESGSPRILELMNKPFNRDHALRMIRAARRHGIRSQACFVLGWPDENDEDRLLTRRLVRDLTRAGVDETVFFIMTPVPGSKMFGALTGYRDYQELNFSPSWRADYPELNRARKSLYASFLFWKLLFHPLALAMQPFRFLLRRFETKMEMTPYRALHTAWLMSVGTPCKPESRAGKDEREPVTVKIGSHPKGKNDEN